jgi:hypothetical protein
MTSGQTLLVLEEELVEMNLGWSALQTYVFTATITDQFILGLDVPRAYRMMMHFKSHILLSGQRIVVIMASQSMTKCFPHGAIQWSGNNGLL